jgi:cation diffusion facilitator family transporter
VNIASAWILSGGRHHHGHSHDHPLVHHTDHAGHDHDEAHRIATPDGVVVLKVFEDGVQPRFRLRSEPGAALTADSVTMETVRPDGTRQLFTMVDGDGECLESVEEVPEPHEFTANVRIGEDTYSVVFKEHDHAHGAALRDNNMQAAVIHVIADATVSVLVIVGLLLARAFGWLWIDPVVGIVGACVITSWSYNLIRDTGAILLDMIPDRRMADNLRQTIEGGGDTLLDLHLWRLGPGHLGAILLIGTTQEGRGPDYYRAKLARFCSLSHLTIEVTQVG